MDGDFSDWFTREILAHEAALTRYLARNWLRSAEIPDMRHDVYVKVMEAAKVSRPRYPKAFLFATARNLMTDRIRHDRVIPIDLLMEADASNVLKDELSPERNVSGIQHLMRLTQAFETLPDRCREVVWLRKIEDVSQKQIAQRMGIAEATVEAHLLRGMKMLMRRFTGADTDETNARTSTGEHERHGR
jgi:RNA polymerase sigma-70 factor (ECF subfamily)